MRNFDLAPLYRASIGFDQIADMMDRVLAGDVNQPTYPLTTLKRRPMMPTASPSPSQGSAMTSYPSSCAKAP